ncbi:MAG TPA: branched-chain amino acid ABC transporter ATP-binding protein/permease, partial [Actinomycetales bacterium]|nr:branched-chain amino acid ABC transporter ATP-binding protein/permease [Actinomycetales bacterium]
VLAGVLGLLLAIPAMRVSGPYLAGVTLAFGIIVHAVAANYPGLTGGAAGIFPIPGITLFGTRLNIEQLNYVIVILVAAGMYTVGSLIHSRWGRALRAISGNPIAAASSGVPIVHGKRMAFLLSAVLAGGAGSFYAVVNSFVNPDPFHFDLSILFLTMLMVGGVGTLWGPIVGVTIMILVERSLSGVANIQAAVYAVILLLILRFLPQGVVGSLQVYLRRIRSRFRHSPSTTAPTPAEDQLTGANVVAEELFGDLAHASDSPQETVPALEVRNVSRRFGELVAVSDVSMTVAQGSAHALVGPNGAGKTTLFNLISGVDTPSEGEITVLGTPTTGLHAHRIAALGVARTFQNLALFDELSVLENVLVGSHLRSHQGFLDSLLRTPKTFREEDELTTLAHQILALVDLDEYAGEEAGGLPQGLRRRLELARALASNPQILLLDEPAAGLNPQEVDHLSALIRRIRDTGVTVVLVEHHMKLVMAVSDAVTVLDGGSVIAEGRPQDVQNNPRVAEAYLGVSGRIGGGGE